MKELLERIQELLDYSQCPCDPKGACELKDRLIALRNELQKVELYHEANN